MKEGGKKLAVYPAMGAVTVLRQGRSPVWFIFVFWPHLAVCLAHSQGPAYRQALLLLSPLPPEAACYTPGQL